MGTPVDQRPGFEPVLIESEEHDPLHLVRYIDTDKVFEFCTRCGGTGEYSFNPLDGTRCFGCSGRGFGKATTVADAVRRAKARRKAQRRRDAKRAAEVAQQVEAAREWREGHPALVAALEKLGEHDTFLGDMAAQVQYKPLTERQTVAALEAVERVRQRLAVQEKRHVLGHLGEIGKPIELTVILQRTRYFPAERFDRSGRFLVTMHTPEGHIVKTWNTGAFGVEATDALEREPERPTWTIRGTVNEHGEYNDTPETTLTRVKRVS